MESPDWPIEPSYECIMLPGLNSDFGHSITDLLRMLLDWDHGKFLAVRQYIKKGPYRFLSAPLNLRIIRQEMRNQTLMEDFIPVLEKL